MKGCSGGSRYKEWANVGIKGCSGRSCYKEWANVGIKGCSVRSHCSAQVSLY